MNDEEKVKAELDKLAEAQGLKVFHLDCPICYTKTHILIAKESLHHVSFCPVCG